MKARLNFLKLSVLLFFIASMLINCTSPRDLIESGNYDQAIELAIRKIKGKKNKSPKHVRSLETAFRKANHRDVKMIKSLKYENRPENWEKINLLYQDIAHRQNLIEPFLPLVDKKGYEASFGFIKIESEQVEAKEKSANYLYDHAKSLLEQYNKTGKKYFARDAYGELVKIDALYTEFKDKELLKETAYNLGTDRYFFKISNNSNKILPNGFLKELLSIGFQQFENDWKVFDIKKLKGVNYDYMVNLSVIDAHVSPEKVKERQFDETKTIEEGKAYVLDDNGNVMKDSLGNDITIPKKVFIKATLLENYQHKSAFVAANLEFHALRRKSLLQSTPLEVSFLFENYSSKLLSGDKRAITKETKKNLGHRPVHFPSDEIMLTDAARDLKYKVKRIIEDFFPSE